MTWCAPACCRCRRPPPAPPPVQDIDEGEGVAAVKEAFDRGINFFDTSPYYGDTKSETVGGPAAAPDQAAARWQRGGTSVQHSACNLPTAATQCHCSLVFNAIRAAS